MNFSDIIDNYKRIAIVGTFKNAGKTVALNEFVNIAASKGKRIGLTSIGRDGERQDIVTNTEKPPIYVQAGTVLATAELCAQNSEAPLEILEVTDFLTAIGRVVIARAKENGYIEIAGPDSNSEIKSVCDMMLDHYAEVVFIDGALNRKTQASPAVADGVVLSTGAVLGRSIDVVVEKTVHTVKMLTLPTIDDEMREACEKAATLQQVSFIDQNRKVVNTHFRTALGSANKIAAMIRDEHKAIVIPGTLMNSFIKTMQGVLRTRPIEIVVQNGTKVFLEPMDFRIFEKLGGRIRVIDPINLLAVSVNPCSPEGYQFEPAYFHAAMSEALAPLDVYDCIQEGGM